MIVFDTEDDSSEILEARRKGDLTRSGFDKTVTQIAAICDNGKRFINDGCPLEFLKWCHQQKDRDIWAFHTQYDIGNLCNDRQKLKLDDFDVTMVKGRFIKGQIQGLNFFDVMNIAGAGQNLGTLGLAVDLPKFGYPYTEKEQSQFSPARLKEWKEFGLMDKAELFRNKRYVFRDCEIPMKWLKFVKSQCEELLIEKIPATLGSMCVKSFETLDNTNWHECSSESQLALIGARVELFNQGGTGRIAYLDINSLYPHCMTMRFPTCMEKLESLDGYGIASCDVEIPEHLFVAPLPYRDEEKRLLFPVGRFSGVWTIAEINNAVRAGAKVKKLHWAMGSPSGSPYYRSYILDMYERRMRSKSPAESLFWKLLMNNLYGRLAISGEVSRSLNLTDENKLNGTIYGKKILATHKMPLPEFTNYLHAATVLSYARIVLHGYLEKIPREDLIYCDTDSVFFFCKAGLPFPVSKELGAMKLEAWGGKCEPVLPKTYIFDKLYKAKGVPKNRAKEFIDHRHTEYDTPYKMRESINFYEMDNSRKCSVWRSVEKDLTAVYDKKRKKGNLYLPKKVNDDRVFTSAENWLAEIVTQ